MTATVTINNPTGNLGTVYVTEHSLPEYEQEYTIVPGESRTFSVFEGKWLSIEEYTKGYRDVMEENL